MTILANDEDLGKEGQEIISCKYNGEQATIGFNHKYLIEMIQNLDNDDDEYELMIAFNQTNRPVILKPNTDDDTIIMILMPVRS
jgi:DNA polymerase III sliding clamp (beta) subunit (PCNA family)